MRILIFSTSKQAFRSRKNPVQCFYLQLVSQSVDGCSTSQGIIYKKIMVNLFKGYEAATTKGWNKWLHNNHGWKQISVHGENWRVESNFQKTECKSSANIQV